LISELLFTISDLQYDIGVQFDIGATIYYIRPLIRYRRCPILISEFLFTISDLRYDIGGVLFDIGAPIYYIGVPIYISDF